MVSTLFTNCCKVIVCILVEFETQRLQEICDRLEDELRQKEKPGLKVNGRKRSISDIRDVNKVRLTANKSI